ISREKTPHIYIYNRKMKGLFFSPISGMTRLIPEKHAAPLLFNFLFLHIFREGGGH
ncbi:hypothetical protein ACJX0J_003246, partial (mitochondrion) [Zea mays]